MEQNSAGKVSEYLESIGFEKKIADGYAQKFIDNGYDINFLRKVSPNDTQLIGMGFSIPAHRHLIVNSLSKIKDFTAILEGWLLTIKRYDILQNSWKQKSLLDYNGRIGQCFPFVNRKSATKKFKYLLQEHLRWLKKVHTDSKGQRYDELHKEKGFSFIVVAAASGMGKTTFCRRVFEILLKNKDDNQEFVMECVQKEHLFRISYVGGLVDSEEFHSQSYSLGIRLLFQYLQKRYIFEDNLLKFTHLFKTVSGINLISVLEWISKQDNSDSYVIHLDETNHINENNHLLQIMSQCYTAMRYFKLVVVISGTDIHRLSTLKQTSHFNCEQIFLSPISNGGIVSIFYSILAMLNAKEDEPSTDLVLFLEENGGNPQILEFQIGALDETGLENKDPEIQDAILYDEWDSDIEEMEEKVDVKQSYINSKRVEKFTGDGLKLFMKNPSSDLVNLARNRTWLRLQSAHVLSSLKYCDSAKLEPLREMIYGYAVSGDMVERTTELVPNCTVEHCEQKGYFFLKPKGRNHNFTIILPTLYLLKYTWRVASKLPLLSVLEEQKFNSGVIEHIDIETIAFRIWWFVKTSKQSFFRLQDIFPAIPFSPAISNLEFCAPTDFNRASLSYKFDGNWERLINEKWTFGVHCPGDKTLDSFVLLKQYGTFEPFYWKILIQSKLRTKGEKDSHNFTDEDLLHQLRYLRNTTNWIMFIRTDATFEPDLSQYTEKNTIIPIDFKNSETFYTPLISHIRRGRSISRTWKDLEINRH